VLEARKGDASLSDAERKLENFDVYVTEVESGYEVNVVPRPDEGGSAGGMTAYGRDMVYVVGTDFVVAHSQQLK
jgi:hypothetical protein